MPGFKPQTELVLSDEQRAELTRLTRRRKTPRGLALRATIVLACADEPSISAAAKTAGVTWPTAKAWRERFIERGVDGLCDEPRSGAPRSIGDDRIEEVVRTTLEETPPNATHWSTRSLAKRLGLSQSAVSRIWRAFGLQPHRSETFKLSTDPYFVDKVRDVVGLYMSPPANAIVFCVDEKSQCQALDRSQPVLPMTPGRPERRTHDYFRHGTTSLFAALNVKTGEVFGRCRRRHRAQDFLSFLRQLDAFAERAPGTEIHLVLDNYATHKTPAVKRWFARRPHYRLHFTPTGASWLNQVERFFAEITNKRLRRGVFRSVPQLERAIRDYVDGHNADAKPFVWTADADLILRRVESVCEETSNSGH
ncbi:IS630 family transposase [Alienimonas sp. DA493]|uniref:IS630 family transposase n=1 Tax=Alienimonas sp. DA493 TaxID=3373605 RepID=UPI003755403A